MKTCCFVSFCSKDRAFRTRQESFALKRLVWFAIVVLVCLTTRVDAQLADSFDPNPNSSVNLIVVQPDGKILIAGFFTALSPNGGEPIARNHFARLNADGTVDLAFDANVNPAPPGESAITAIALQTDGKILVGGAFSEIGGQLRSNIARLDPATGLADSFNVSFDGYGVAAIAVQSDGKILVGGIFSSIGGQPRNNMARIDPVTGLADSFDPNADKYVGIIKVLPDDNILIGGYFFHVGGEAHRFFARLDPTTGLPTPFGPYIAVDPPASIVIQSDAKVIIGTLDREFVPLFRLLSQGGVDETFLGRVSGGRVYALALQQDGKIILGGNFAGVWHDSDPLVPRNSIARMYPDGEIDMGFDPNPDGGVNTLAVQADGKILVGGDFSSIGGQARNNMARLRPNLSNGCVFGLGYWKNRPQAWCMETIQIGCGTYTQTQAIAVMRHSSGQDKTYSLAQQLITARLNVICKSSNPECVSNLLIAADSFLCAHPIGSGVTANSSAWQQIKATHAALEKYNAGRSCSPSCDAM